MQSQDEIDDWSWEVVSSEYKKLQNSRLEGKSKILENRVVREYLVHKCEGCTETPCFNYHQGQKPRRQLVSLGEGKWNYTSKRCQKPRCVQEKCPFAHSTEEIYFHPDKYKKDPCKYKTLSGICEFFGHFCPYQHAQIDIIEEINEKFDLETFKTTKCSIKQQHMYSTCSYYHDYLRLSDKRRSLKEFNYSAENCPNYGNCEEGDNCKFCHNEIEFKYHPLRFKTKPCAHKENCRNKESCPYFHVDANDRADDKTKDFIEIVEKCQDLAGKCQKLQQVTFLLDRFWCSVCRDQKSEGVMDCGHTRCGKCKEVMKCFLCGCETSVFIKFKFDD